MLIRISGGKGGIAEYLENGIKNDRDFTRDELDERLILDGDLTATDMLIKQMSTNGQRYLHITLAFKEDYLTPETLREITQDFKQFTFQAYGDHEYNFYAEAHLPKIKSFQDKSTGETIERKPHIHVVIPEINLDTGNKLEPFGKVSNNEKFIDAFQETINEKYGLASPKIHRRDNFTSESTILSRSKGDVFKGNNPDLKAQILERAMDNNVHSQADLANMLAKEGYQVRVRNSGKPNTYLNIKKPEHKKGTNLKEKVFTDSFLNQPKEAQLASLNNLAHPYIESHTDKYRATDKDRARLLQWQEKRAFEVRYVNARNRKDYLSLPPTEQLNFLKNKQQEKANVPGITRDNIGTTNDHLVTAGNHLRNAQRNCHGIEPGRRRIADRRTLRAISTVISRYEGYQRPPRLITERRTASNVLGQAQKDFQERDNATTARTQFYTIKRDLDAKQLLLSLAQSHGVIYSKYQVNRSEAGERIRTGKHNLNVADFLTKEMNLSWKDASQILVKEYSRQQGHGLAPVTPRDRDRFSQQWRPSFDHSRKEAWREQREKERKLRSESKQHFKTEKNAIYADLSLEKPEKKAALSIARMNKVINDINLSRRFKDEREILKEHYPSKVQSQYQIFDSNKINTESKVMSREITGTLVEHGTAPYKNLDGNKDSYFVTVESNDNYKTIWSLDLERALSESKLEIGDKITLEHKGEKLVEVDVEQKDHNGKIISTKKINTPRNIWEAREAPQQELKPEQIEQNKEQAHIEITFSDINKKLNASRIINKYPILRNSGLTLDNVYKMPSGEEIHIDGKKYNITDFVIEKTGLSEKQVFDDLAELYKQQLSSQDRMAKYADKSRPSLPYNVSSENPDNQPEIIIKYSVNDDSKLYKAIPIQFDQITYKTDDKGNVNYYFENKMIVKDNGREVQITRTEEKAIEIGLRLSIEKFGSNLDVKGSEDYKNMVAEVAAVRGLKVQFTDSKMNDRYQEAIAQVGLGRNTIEKAEQRLSPEQPGQNREQTPSKEVNLDR
jgi:hypothetical protein